MISAAWSVSIRHCRLPGAAADPPRGSCASAPAGRDEGLKSGPEVGSEMFRLPSLIKSPPRCPESVSFVGYLVKLWLRSAQCNNK